MTRNLTIATVFLLAATLLLGYIWVRENTVLAQREQRFNGALLTRGARDYEQYCASCHGLTGEGGVANGAPQINNLPNTLGDRLNGATGIVAKYGTVRNFVEATITSGVRGTAMPRWSARLGGPLRDDQIANIAAYVSSWWGPEGSTSPNISADAAAAAAAYKKAQQAAASAGAPDTPVGRGNAIFQANCSSCHNLNSKDSGVPAPGLGGLFGPDGTAAFGKKLPNGKDATPENWAEWVKKGGAAFANSAIQPASGFGPYVIAAMPGFPQFDDKQLGDLLAFLSTHDRDGNTSLPPIGLDGKPLPNNGGAATGNATPTPTK
ncbi:MAG TPA: c-type cytochrome [Kouleothrix sp.]|uniref:cytochrome c n=1 Tax=Kouleothrix sp. TaxID=2779161 RepID=UPI002CFDEB2B|nr:c-type cytochrome [Kouleothrix sp.]